MPSFLSSGAFALRLPDGESHIEVLAAGRAQLAKQHEVCCEIEQEIARVNAFLASRPSAHPCHSAGLSDTGNLAWYLERRVELQHELESQQLRIHNFTSLLATVEQAVVADALGEHQRGRIDLEASPFASFGESDRLARNYLCTIMSEVQSDVIPGTVEAMQQMHNSMGEVSTLEKQAIFTALAFGNGAITPYLRAFQSSGIPRSVLATYFFNHYLVAFHNSIDPTKRSIRRELQNLIKEYQPLYYSSLLRGAIKRTEVERDQNLLLYAHTNRLLDDIWLVLAGAKERGICQVGYSSHVVILMYEYVEKLEGDNALRVSLFNLGGQSRQTGHLDRDGLRQHEVRLGDVVDPDGGGVEMSAEYFREHAATLAYQLMKIGALGTRDEYRAFVQEYSPERREAAEGGSSRRPADMTIMYQEPQEMGDCAAKSQWAVIRKLMARHGLRPEVYQSFEQFVRKQSLKDLALLADVNLSSLAPPIDPDGFEGELSLNAFARAVCQVNGR